MEKDMKVDYIYKRKDGGTTNCYGTIREDSNFAVVCDNEAFDNVWTDNEKLKTWGQVCSFLEKTYNTQIEEITAV